MSESELSRLEMEVRFRRGPEAAISAADLARVCDIPTAPGGRSVRALITELVRRGVPIGATEHGYFLITENRDLERYCAELEQREMGIRARIVAVRRAFYDGAPSREEGLRWVPEPEEIG